MPLSFLMLSFLLSHSLQPAYQFSFAPVGALIKRPLQNCAAILKISAGNKIALSLFSAPVIPTERSEWRDLRTEYLLSSCASAKILRLRAFVAPLRMTRYSRGRRENWVVGGVMTPALRVRWETGGRVAERSESSNPMIASGNHTDSNSDRPYGCGDRLKNSARITQHLKGRVKTLPYKDIRKACNRQLRSGRLPWRCYTPAGCWRPGCRRR